MTKKYSLTVFLGRMVPLHEGHATVIREARQISEKVLVGLGSAFRPASTRIPYSVEQREKMLRLAFPDSEDWLIIEPIEDFTYNDPLWLAHVQDTVRKHEPDNSKIALIGFEKDHTSFYVNMFPQWDNVGVEPYMVGGEILNASDIRKAQYQNGGIIPEIFNDASIIHPDVFNYVNDLDNSLMAREFEIEVKYKSQFDHPYFGNNVIHNTVDAVVIQSGHVLVGKRSALPGRGLYCLPGGFMEPHETVLDAMLCELREETKIKVPSPVLKGNIKDVQLFDDPNRSTRGRILTTAYLIELPNGPLPKVKASDDLMKGSAMWMPLGEVNSMTFFEDHYDIIQIMTGRRKRQ